MIANIHSLLPSSSVNGPGQRAVLWFQGCTLSCNGCWNQETHSLKGGTHYPIWKLMDWIQEATKNPAIEGITLSGGEPMQQAPVVIELLIALNRYMPRLGIGMFSGYSAKELRTGAFHFAHDAAYRMDALKANLRIEMWYEIQRRLDFAILGRYNAGKPNPNPMTTSTNQELVLYSNRYTAADFPPQTTEVQIDEAGLVQISGFPTLGNIN